MLALALLVGSLPESVWVEAEWFGPLNGANFSFMREDLHTKGSWSLAGPDVAAAWTQGGESEFLSIAARADEPAGTTVAREIVVPTAGEYRLWVRYADYRERQEEFVVRVRQGARTQDFKFGAGAVVDELDPMKLLWDWAYGWDSRTVSLEKGTATLELVTTGPTGARRCIDCLCLTQDESYNPNGREKPRFSSWTAFGEESKEALVAMPELPAPEALAPPAFLWNVGAQWKAELEKPLAERVDRPFSVDPPLLNDFLAAFKGAEPAVYSDPLSGPVWHIPNYPTAFATGSPFLQWLERNPSSRFAILLNYGDPQWPEGSDRVAVRANLLRHKNRFVGFIAGESISYAYGDQEALRKAVAAARTRGEVLAALKKHYTDATVAKFTDYFGAPVTASEAWADVVSCLSANNEALCHALGAWGVKRIGHENTGNSPSLARRLAFLRGAARQFGCSLLDYQSANLGDSATMFSREAYFYPASSRYILDNSYDAWAGAGVEWLLKDYLLWYLSGVDAFYNEQGVDIYWKPAGGAAGDDFPVQLSPKGKIALAVQRVVGAHQRPEPYHPVAFLLDETHGWSQERFQPGSFGLDPSWNPLLRPGRHEAAVRGWFDIAYFPAPLTQNEPAASIRQTFVNGVFGDLFDVLVTAPGRTAALSRYPVVVAAGEIDLTREWSAALREYAESGGTLVVSVSQFTGAPFELAPRDGPRHESSSFAWRGKASESALFEHVRSLAGGDSLATTPGGVPLVTRRNVGKGQVIAIGVPLGLGLDDRPVPFLTPLLRDLVEGLTPVRVRGDAEWTLGRLPDGGWVVGVFNNTGPGKPQHGVLPTDAAHAVTVTIEAGGKIERATEWVAGQRLTTEGASFQATLPPGSVRIFEVHVRKGPGGR